MLMSKIKIKILDNGTELYKLKKATIGSAGFDLVAAINKDLIIKPNSSTIVPCGFSLALPKNFEAQVRPRSGLALKNMVTVLNSPGTIDSDYRGEICVILINHGKEVFNVSVGMRIAQIIFKTIPNFEIIEVNKLDKTERGDGGFGSTGLK
ncbi:dUTP diphosphatase [Rickettsiales bacterium]|nr:dUTP diphosphatase [Rickettsiales bacterium]